MRIDQSSVIAGALIIAFFTFITVRGELPAYIGVFTGTIPNGGVTNGGGSVVNPGGGGGTSPGSGGSGGSSPSGGLCSGQEVIVNGICTAPGGGGSNAGSD